MDGRTDRQQASKQIVCGKKGRKKNERKVKDIEQRKRKGKKENLEKSSQSRIKKNINTLIL